MSILPTQGQQEISRLDLCRDRWRGAFDRIVFYRSLHRSEIPPVRLGTEAATGSSIPQKSIAVLPFENLSDDKGAAYFADGIQDEILTKLASIADLKVISRTSTAKYKSKPEDLKTVSQQLGVATVLEGSVQKATDKVRVNVQLIDARADSHLWAKSYDRDMKDVFAIQSEVAQEIADSLQAKLSPAEANTLATAPTKDTAAYDLFLKGESEHRVANSFLEAGVIRPSDRLVSASHCARSEFRARHGSPGRMSFESTLVHRNVDRSGARGSEKNG